MHGGVSPLNKTLEAAVSVSMKQFVSFIISHVYIKNMFQYFFCSYISNQVTSEHSKMLHTHFRFSKNPTLTVYDKQETQRTISTLYDLLCGFVCLICFQ